MNQPGSFLREKLAGPHWARPVLAGAFPLAVFSILLTSLCFSSLAQATGKFRIKESGYWTCDSAINSKCIYWLDEERVIFSGTRAEDFEIRQGRRIWNYALYIWDIRADRVAKYAEASPRQFCYADGYIRYLRATSEKPVLVAGQFGKESIVDNLPDKSTGTGWITEFSCGQYQPQPSHPLVGIKVGLRKGGGFVYLGTQSTPDSAKASVQYFPDQASKPIDLPLQRWQVNASEIQPITFKDAYLLLGDQIYNRSDRCVPEGFARRVHRMSADGTVESISLPLRKELRCHVEWRGVNEVRPGFTVHINTGQLPRSYLYLVQGERITTLVKGRVSQSATSPSGCKLAIALSASDDPLRPISNEFNRGHLKVIELCANTPGGG